VTTRGQGYACAGEERGETAKARNKKLYRKLNIGSLKELPAYAGMLKAPR